MACDVDRRFLPYFKIAIMRLPDGLSHIRLPVSLIYSCSSSLRCWFFDLSLVFAGIIQRPFFISL